MESASHQRTAPIIVDRGSKDGDRSSTEDEDEQFLVHEEVQPPEMETVSTVLKMCCILMSYDKKFELN